MMERVRNLQAFRNIIGKAWRVVEAMDKYLIHLDCEFFIDIDKPFSGEVEITDKKRGTSFYLRRVGDTLRVVYPDDDRLQCDVCKINKGENDGKII